MTSAQIIIVVTIVLYLAAMVLVGVYFGKKGSGSSSDDFYLGGRKMGPVVTAMSAEASDMSSYLLMGLPGLAYLFGHYVYIYMVVRRLEPALDFEFTFHYVYIYIFFCNVPESLYLHLHSTMFIFICFPFLLISSCF